MNIEELRKIILSIKYFKNNKYLTLYCELIINNKNTVSKPGITERHHFIPVSYYSICNKCSDRKIANKQSLEDKDNFLVNLTHFEHLLAHYYLSLCSEGYLYNKLCYAFMQMVYCNSNLLTADENTVIQELTYISRLRENFGNIISNKHRGVPESLESNLKRSESLKGKNTGPKTDAHKRALSEAAKHRKVNSTKGRISIYNAQLNKKKYVTLEDLQKYLNEG